MDDTTTTTTSGTDPAVIKALKEERKGLRAELKQGVSSEREKRIGKRILQIKYQIAKENLKDKPPEVKEKLKKQNLERAKRSINNKLQKANMKAPPGAPLQHVPSSTSTMSTRMSTKSTGTSTMSTRTSTMSTRTSTSVAFPRSNIPREDSSATATNSNPSILFEGRRKRKVRFMQNIMNMWEAFEEDGKILHDAAEILDKKNMRTAHEPTGTEEAQDLDGTFLDDKFDNIFLSIEALCKAYEDEDHVAAQKEQEFHEIGTNEAEQEDSEPFMI